MKKVVLITTGQPSLNPRIVKEADVLQKAGYSVTLLYCFWIEWATEMDETIFKGSVWDFKLVGGRPGKHSFTYYRTRLRFKVNQILSKKGFKRGLVAERAQARCYDELLSEAKRQKADLYIGHNLGSLAVTVRAAAQHNSQCGFDFEDYHRGEKESQLASEVGRVKFLEQKYIPFTQYLSFSSAMIESKFREDFPCSNSHRLTLMNCFSLKEQPKFRVSDSDTRLKLFWFSQTVGKNRGLEDLMRALKTLNDPSIELTLAGRCTSEMKEFFKSMLGNLKDNLHFVGLITPADLPAFSARFDVGLALELDHPENRNLCLTNKIFTYLLAGNAIIFSETMAQKQFNEEYNAGLSFPLQDVVALAENIRSYKNTGILYNQRTKNYSLASESLNLECESINFLKLIDSLTN